jgi:hypothetical protein
VALRPQLGQLGLLRAQRVGLGVVAHVGQHVAALDRLACDRQALRPGLDAPAVHGLHAAAGVRVHDHATGQLDRGGGFGLGRQHGADGHAPLRDLGHVDAAIGQPRQARGIDGSAGCVEVFAVGSVGARCGVTRQGLGRLQRLAGHGLLGLQLFAQPGEFQLGPMERRRRLGQLHAVAALGLERNAQTDEDAALALGAARCAVLAPAQPQFGRIAAGAPLQLQLAPRLFEPGLGTAQQRMGRRRRLGGGHGGRHSGDLRRARRRFQSGQQPPLLLFLLQRLQAEARLRGCGQGLGARGQRVGLGQITGRHAARHVGGQLLQALRLRLGLVPGGPQLTKAPGLFAQLAGQLQAGGDALHFGQLEQAGGDGALGVALANAPQRQAQGQLGLTGAAVAAPTVAALAQLQARRRRPGAVGDALFGRRAQAQALGERQGQRTLPGRLKGGAQAGRGRFVGAGVRCRMG